MRGAVAVEGVPAVNAEAGFERGGAVEDAGVDDLGVAGGGLGWRGSVTLRNGWEDGKRTAHSIVPLKKDRGCPRAPGELLRDGEADDAAAYDLNICPMSVLVC